MVVLRSYLGLYSTSTVGYQYGRPVQASSLLNWLILSCPKYPMVFDNVLSVRCVLPCARARSEGYSQCVEQPVPCGPKDENREQRTIETAHSRKPSFDGDIHHLGRHQEAVASIIIRELSSPDDF